MSEPYQIPNLPQEPRDLALGRYMDAWSRMEGFLYLIFTELTGADAEVSRVLYSTLNAKPIRDVLSSLGSIRLNEDGASRLTKLCERVGKQATKRNHIIHGAWVTSVIISDTKPPSDKRIITTTWVRTYTPVQYELAKQSGRYDLPKVGEHYAFTIDQLERTTNNVLTLMGELSTFLADLPSLRKPPPQPDEERP